MGVDSDSKNKEEIERLLREKALESLALKRSNINNSN
jgi:hypothetical protein